MPSFSTLRGLVATLSFLAACALSSQAAAECEVGRGNVGLAFVWAERDCAHNLHADLRYGLYTSSQSTSWQTLFAGEIGLLERVGDTRWQIGPVLALGGAGQSHDWSGAFDEFYLSPRVRARMWMIDEWMTFEGAVGPSILWNQGPRGDWLSRVGGYVEVGPTLHGIVGFYVGTGYTPSGGDEHGSLPAEWRQTFGLRVNVTFAAAAAALGGILYACGKSPTGCN